MIDAGIDSGSSNSLLYNDDTTGMAA